MVKAAERISRRDYQQSITIIGLEPHPEDKKNGAYARIARVASVCVTDQGYLQ